MNLLNGKDLITEIHTNSLQVIDRLWVASAFCRSEAFVKYFSQVNPACENKEIFIRWQPRDLLSGSSDLDLFHAAEDAGYKIFINQRLHAKSFLFDNLGIIGSANLTFSGMPRSINQGNLELCTKVHDNGHLRDWFNQLRQTSILLDEDIFSSICKDIERFGSGKTEAILNQRSFSPETMRLLSKRNKLELYTNDLLWSSSPSDLLVGAKSKYIPRNAAHDLQILGLDSGADLSEISERFLVSSAFRWLDEKIDLEMYFGSLTHALHSDLLDDPSPYRKDVKILISNLLNWVRELVPSQYGIDAPNRSQRIFRIS